MKKLKTLFVDTEKGKVVVNGEVLENVTAFSVIFKDGEYGLQVTSDDIYTSATTCSKIFLELLPDKIFNQGVSGQREKP